MNEFHAVILAAGKGTRMGSQTPKVLMEVGGRPILSRVCQAIGDACIKEVTVVVGGQEDDFKRILQPSVRLVRQEERRGTADALASVSAVIDGVAPPKFAKGTILRGDPVNRPFTLVLVGDVPGIQGAMIADFCTFSLEFDLSVLAFVSDEPTGYGRILQNNHQVRIVEEKNASEEEKKIQICNSGIISGRTDVLWSCLSRVEPNMESNEYYLTDVLEIASRRGFRVGVHVSSQSWRLLGANTPFELKQLEQRIKESD